MTLDSPQNVETLQWMVDKVTQRTTSPRTDVEMAGQGDGDLFKAGKIAMLRTGIWMFGDFAANAKFKWDIALEPGNTNKAHHFFANGVAVSATSAQPAGRLRVDQVPAPRPRKRSISASRRAGNCRR